MDELLHDMTTPCLFRESPVLALSVCACTLLARNYTPAFLLGTAVFVALLYFYRTPVRSSDALPQYAIVAPCDGEVVEIEPRGRDMTRIVVYLSPLDVHLQWYPTDGVVVEKKHVPGEFNLARILRKSDHNERTMTVIRAVQGWVRVDQIAGQLARRIVNRSSVGDVVRRGDPMGMIKLSSRVDLHVQTRSTTVDVRVGDRVIGGETVVARWVRSAPPVRATARRRRRRRGVVDHGGGGGGGGAPAAAAAEDPHARVPPAGATAVIRRRRTLAGVKRHQKQQQAKHE